MYQAKVKQYNFATYFRIMGTAMILLCHFTEQSKNRYLNMSAQFFNVGVAMFFILSGFLFGLQGNVTGNVLKWYCKRVKRIYIPFELFAISLFIIHIYCGISVLKIDWLWFVLGLQGSVVGIYGGEQTWFITALLICYLMTPLISKIINLVEKSDSKKNLFLLIVLLIPLCLALVSPVFIKTMFSPVCWYMLAFYLGTKWERIEVTKKRSILAAIIMCFVFALRIIVRVLADGTILYDRIVISYTQYIAAFCIFLIVAYVFRNKKASRVVTWISSISFEIYLYHYMFCVGPVRLFGLTSNWLVNCLAVTVVTVCIAFVMNRVAKMIAEKIETRVRR